MDDDFTNFKFASDNEEEVATNSKKLDIVDDSPEVLEVLEETNNVKKNRKTEEKKRVTKKKRTRQSVEPCTSLVKRVTKKKRDADFVY